MKIDKTKFEARSQKGCSNSHYVLMKTNCCGRIGVEDIELSEFYFDATTPSRTINLFEELGCPFCNSGSWEIEEIDSNKQVTQEWSWAKCKY